MGGAWAVSIPETRMIENRHEIPWTLQESVETLALLILTAARGDNA